MIKFHRNINLNIAALDDEMLRPYGPTVNLELFRPTVEGTPRRSFQNLKLNYQIRYFVRPNWHTVCETC